MLLFDLIDALERRARGGSASPIPPVGAPPPGWPALPVPPGSAIMPMPPASPPPPWMPDAPPSVRLLPWPQPGMPGPVPTLIDLLHRTFPSGTAGATPSPWLLSAAAIPAAADQGSGLSSAAQQDFDAIEAAPNGSMNAAAEDLMADAPQLAQTTTPQQSVPPRPKQRAAIRPNSTGAPAQPKGPEARTIAPRIVSIPQDDGSFEIRRDGTRSWQNNNPGNIAIGAIARAHGALGKDDKSKAIFPTEEMGRRAAIAVLQSPKYQAFTIDRAIEQWAPPSENDTPRYQGFVRSQTGLAGNTPLSSLTPQQMQRLYEAIVRYEGWKQGDTTIDRR